MHALYMGMLHTCGCMQPTLNPDENGRRRDMVLVRRGHGVRIDRGDLVTFWSPADPDRLVIKRVVAFPGDEIVSRYDNAIVQKGVKKTVEPDTAWTVPPGHIWVEGDNAHRSVDSNAYGPIPFALVDGKVLRIIWPWRRFRRMDQHDERAHIWQRRVVSKASTQEPDARMASASMTTTHPDAFATAPEPWWAYKM